LSGYFRNTFILVFLTQNVKILYVTNWGIGDLVFATPLIHSLQAAYPHATIEVPIRHKPGTTAMLSLIRGVHQSPVEVQTTSELGRLRKEVMATGNGWEQVIAQDKKFYEEAFADRSYDLVLVGRYLTIDTLETPKQISLCQVSKEPKHSVDSLLELGQLAGVPPVYDFSLEVALETPKLTDGTPIQPTRPYVLLNLATSNEAKSWTSEGFTGVGTWCRQQGYDVLLLGTHRERAIANAVSIPGALDLIPQQGINLSLHDFANLAREASVIVSGDTGLLHIADAMGAFAVGLYGPTSPVKYAPYHNKAFAISRNETDRQMASIRASDVIGVLEKQLHL
jgi:heptosyltransferase III